MTVRQLTVLDLFSGIGGFSLGLERAGMRTVAFCEIDPYCRAVLKKHWPGVPIFEDVRKLTAADITESVDVICGGYPCQPFSLAGKRLGAADDRHLWPEYFRLVQELRPTWVLGENVVGHIGMGLDNVLSDLEGAGYATRTFVIPAVAVDAKHRRDRTWIVAHSEKLQRDGGEYHAGISVGEQSVSESGDCNRSADVADSTGQRQQGSREPSQRCCSAQSGEGKAIDAFSGGVGCQWGAEPSVGRVANGIPIELDLLGKIDESRSVATKANDENSQSTCDSIKWKVLQSMWENRKIAETSPKLYERILFDCLPNMPRCYSSEGWFLGAWIEKSKGLRDLWEAFYSTPFNEAQDLQRELLKRIGQIERTKEVGPSSGRNHRLRALGNAVVPEIPEIIGRAIIATKELE